MKTKMLGILFGLMVAMPISGYSDVGAYSSDGSDQGPQFEVLPWMDDPALYGLTDTSLYAFVDNMYVALPPAIAPAPLNVYTPSLADITASVGDFNPYSVDVNAKATPVDGWNQLATGGPTGTVATPTQPIATNTAPPHDLATCQAVINEGRGYFPGADLGADWGSGWLTMCINGEKTPDEIRAIFFTAYGGNSVTVIGKIDPVQPVQAMIVSPGAAGSPISAVNSALSAGNVNATPCTVEAGKTTCTTTVSWNTNNPNTNICVSMDGGPLQLTASQGASGSISRDWIQERSAYNFSVIVDAPASDPCNGTQVASTGLTNIASAQQAAVLNTPVAAAPTPGPVAGLPPKTALSPCTYMWQTYDSAAGVCKDDPTQMADGAGATSPSQVVVSLTPSVVAIASNYLRTNGGTIANAIGVGIQQANAAAQLSQGYLYNLGIAAQSELMSMGYGAYTYTSGLLGPVAADGSFPLK